MNWRLWRIAAAVLLIAAGAAGVLTGADAPETKRVLVIPVEGTIDLGLAPFISRGLKQAETEGMAAVILDIDTFGGRVDAAVQIRDALIESELLTVAWIHPRAISAGALISLACTKIAVTSGATIGAATPVQLSTGGEASPTDEKTVSYVRGEFGATAEARERKAEIAEAMVDKDIEIEGLIEKGKLLTLKTDAALEWGIADFQADNRDELLRVLELEGADVIEIDENWAEDVARVLTGPVINGLLLSIGFLALMIELYSPGFGWAGGTALICFFLFFFGQYTVNLAGIEEILLFAIGVVLLTLELFVIPGFGVAGIAGILAILASLVMALISLPLHVSWNLGFLSDAVTLVGSVFLFTLVAGLVIMRTMLAGRGRGPLVLKEHLRSPDEVQPVLEWDPLGKVGRAVTDLRPSGTIQIDGRKVNAVSEGEFIAKGSDVLVIGQRTGSYLVRVKG